MLLQYDPPKPYCTESLGEKLAVDSETLADTIQADNDLLIADAERSGIEDSRILDNVALQSRIETAIDDQQRKLQQLTLSGLAALNATIIEDAQNDDLLGFNGWNQTMSK